jgi:hypothetical protein
MGRMIDLIKQASIPATMMRTAARGALSVAPGEMVEILVYLTANPAYGDEASLTLAGWDQKTAKAIAEDPDTAPEVLAYFMDPDNLRIPLLNSLLDNPSVKEDLIMRLGMQASAKALTNMLWHPRVLANKSTLHAISMNVNLPLDDASVVRSALANLGENTEYLIEQAELDADALESMVPNDILDAELDRFTREHADEIEAEEGTSFELYVSPAEPPAEEQAAAAGISGAGEVPTLINKAVDAPSPEVEGEAAPDPSLLKKVSAFQKISRLGVGQRVQLAMKGTKDERFILVRDGSKVVSTAVLESPKLTDQEVETFATMKNVQEAVIRGIAGKRKFMRNYMVQKNLANNPRTPLDVALPLIKGLMLNDLRGMAKNKNVNDTVRKMAHKLYKQRSEKKPE